MTLISQGEKAGEDLMIVVTDEGRKGCFLCTRHWSDNFIKHIQNSKSFSTESQIHLLLIYIQKFLKFLEKLIYVAVAGIVS